MLWPLLVPAIFQHLICFRVRLKKWLGERGDGGRGGEGGKMPGNSQPMQCENGSIKYKMSKEKGETFVQWAVIKTDKGLCHGAEGGGLSLVV